MRVLHVINSLGGSGGAEHGLVREVTRFSPDIEQAVVRLFSKDHLDDALKHSGIEVVSLGLDARNAGVNWPLAAIKLASLSRSFGADVLHSSLFTSNLVTHLAARRLRVPALSTFTLSGDPGLLSEFQPGAGSWRAKALRRLAASSAHGGRFYFRALTADAASTNERLLGVDPARVTVIPRGVEVSDGFDPKTRSELGLPSDRRLLVNVGRQTAQKGHLSLLRAFARATCRADSHLVIVGREGDATSELKLAIEAEGLADRVTLTGYTPFARDFLAHADLFVFSSFMEGLGTAVLEAMSLGVPVLAYDIPPVNEITDGGRVATLVDVGNENELSREMDRLLAAPVDVDVPRDWVRERFSIEEVAHRVESLLRDVAAR